MKKIKDLFYGLLGIAFLIGLLYFIYKIFEIGILNINKVNATIIVASIAGIVSITGYFIARYLERQKTIEFQIREQKIPIYEEFVGFLMQMLLDDKFKSLSEEEKSFKMIEFMMKFTQKSLLWMSDETLLEFVKWRGLAQSDNKDTAVSLNALETLFFAFRKDVGHKNKKINKGDLLSLFITDIADYRDRIV